MGKLSFGLFLLMGMMSSASFAITNSQPAIGDFAKFVVTIEGSGIDDKGESYPVYGNGSLISDNLVVTAAHVFAGTKDPTSIEVKVGDYRKPNGEKSRDYYRALDVIKVKKVYFPKSIDAKIRKGLLKKTNAIGAKQDVMLIELERPVDRSKVNYQIVDFVSVDEYQTIAANPDRFKFVGVSVNFWEWTKNSQTKRYAYYNQMSIDGIFNKLLNIPMWSSDSETQLQGFDSGGPLLVNINREWKLIAVNKGFVANGLSSIINDTMKNNGYNDPHVEITPERSIFAPVAYQMCALLMQAKERCR